MTQELKDSSAIECFTGLKFPRDKVEYALFEGIEREGPFKGTYTLFVVDDVPVEEILRLIQMPYSRYGQIYFGAGGRFAYNPETIKKVHDNIDSSKTLITVEDPRIDFDLLISLVALNWMCPIMWHGQPVPRGINSVEKARTMNSWIQDSVIVKIDTGKLVLATELTVFAKSDYSEYGKDKLLLQKEIK